MTDLRKAAEMALDALHNIDQSNNYDAIEALRQALAQPEQEPVAWVECAVIPWLQSKDTNVYAMTKLHRIPNEHYDTPLYTAPPKREWVGLTDEERQEIVRQEVHWSGICRVIEAKLKEKNT